MITLDDCVELVQMTLDSLPYKDRCWICGGNAEYLICPECDEQLNYLTDLTGDEGLRGLKNE